MKRNIRFTFPIEGGFEASAFGRKDRYNTMEIEVSYSMGGINYLSGNSSARGYYIHFSPVTISDKFRQYALGSGHKDLLQEATRYSEKVLNQWADKIRPMAKEIAMLYVAGDLAAIRPFINRLVPNKYPVVPLCGCGLPAKTGGLCSTCLDTKAAYGN